MNTINELLSTCNDTSFWFWIESESKESFFKEISNLNVTFANDRKPALDDIGTFMAINKDNTIAYVSAFIFGKVHDRKESQPRKNVMLLHYSQNGTEILKDCR